MASRLPPLAKRYLVKTLPKTYTGVVSKKPFNFETIMVRDPSMDSCEYFRKYKRKSPMSPVLLGSGKWGNVYQGCDDEKNCDYAIKIISIPDNDWQLEVAIKDAYYLYLLQDVRVDDKPIVPRLFDWYQCDLKNLFTIVMDKYDDNMRTYGIKRLGELSGSPLKKIDYTNSNKLIFTDEELIRMFKIAHSLTINGIIHYDLNPGQYLIRNSDNLIVLSDFGFAGDILESSVERYTKYWEPIIGWMRSYCGSKEQLALMDPLKVFELRKYLNIWQLNTWLLYIDETWIYDSKRDAIVKYGGFILPEIFKEMNKFCSRHVGSPTLTNADKTTHYILHLENLET